MNPLICETPLIPFWGSLNKPSNTQLTHLRILQNHSSYSFPKCLSSKSKSSSSLSSVAAQDEHKQSFLVPYLINSCGLSPQRAIAVFRTYGSKFRFDGPEKPDSILAFMRSHGFNDDDISNVINADPSTLIYTEKNLLLKLQFFYSIGFTKKDLPTFIAKSVLWRHSLDGCLVPLYMLLKDELESDRDLVIAMKRLGLCRRMRSYKNLRANLALIKEAGVPSSKVALVLKTLPAILLIDPDELRGIVDEVKVLGFDVTKSIFTYALHAFSSGYRTTRERCTEIYTEWGFSHEDIQSAFKKWPRCLLLSENKLRAVMEFLVDKMGVQVEAIVKCPYVLSLSLEERIIPRCSVIYVLVQKGLLDQKDWKLSSVAFPSEKDFLNRFVNKNQDIALHLLKVYEGEVDPFKDYPALIGEMEKP
ncbi:hypothetical protein Droror1_Dr00000889 [Drosera rotundifolia]